MGTAVVATLSAVFYGIADMLGGVGSRKDAALPVTVTAQMTGFVLLVAACLIVPPARWADARILWGVGAGVFGGTGVLSLYAGLATGRMSVVAPVTAALSATIPAGFGIVLGDMPSNYALVGMGLALVSVIVVSAFAHDDGTGSGGRALTFALISGAGFGVSILCWAQTPASTMFAPLLVARTTTIVMLVVAALMQRRRPIAAAPAFGISVATGFVDVAANATQVISLRMGPVALAAVLGALYPVVTVVLARFYLHEHLRGWQRVGIAMACVSVVLCAIP